MFCIRIVHTSSSDIILCSNYLCGHKMKGTDYLPATECLAFLVFRSERQELQATE